MKLNPYNLGACGVAQMFCAGTVKFDDANIGTGIKLCDIPKGTFITKAAAVVVTPFNAATTNVITVGYAADTDEILAGADITAGTAGTYSKEMFVLGKANDKIYVKYAQTGTAATAGEADIYLEVVTSPEA
jgi:hypothetical protein